MKIKLILSSLILFLLLNYFVFYLPINYFFFFSLFLFFISLLVFYKSKISFQKGIPFFLLIISTCISIWLIKNLWLKEAIIFLFSLLFYFIFADLYTLSSFRFISFSCFYIQFLFVLSCFLLTDLKILSLPFAFLLIAGSFSASLYYLFWHEHISILESWLYIILFILFSLEIFSILIFWPIDLFSKTMILIISFYLYWGILFNYLNKMLSPKVLIKFLLISALLFALVIAQGRWEII